MENKFKIGDSVVILPTRRKGVIKQVDGANLQIQVGTKIFRVTDSQVKSLSRIEG